MDKTATVFQREEKGVWPEMGVWPEKKKKKTIPKRNLLYLFKKYSH